MGSLTRIKALVLFQILPFKIIKILFFFPHCIFFFKIQSPYIRCTRWQIPTTVIHGSRYVQGRSSELQRWLLSEHHPAEHGVGSANEKVNREQKPHLPEPSVELLEQIFG